ncbi:hypothetical protein [Methylobacterium sp. SD21]|uniref:hypothetical protein n=1 Tax=Methylobacterium litchii TaxID=3138810 RepID=UPI00313C06CF
MMVHRSTTRPPPPKRDRFAGEIRKALGEAKARRGRVTLAMVRGLKEQDQAGGRAHG